MVKDKRRHFLPPLNNGTHDKENFQINFKVSRLLYRQVTQNWNLNWF